jgi:hypothetical protein
MKSHKIQNRSQKNSQSCVPLKGSRRMGGGRVFLKTFRASLFNEDLLNEPNIGWIHLAGHK